MNAENTQQKRSYHEFIQNLSSLSKEIKEDDSFTLLFDEIKKENKSIYNAVVDFNIVKFSIEHPYWDEDENKNKACEVISKECEKVEEAAQKLGDKAKRKLESEVREKLKGYIEGGVKEDGVKIYGNHVSITLEDNKKEFQISEFLNSDFCQKNGISGFSTLHSDGKSGMHGFVAEEEGRKIRHYVVTDGSYEMTLNWYVNGEKCTVTININADGSVERIGGHDVSEEQLRANKDVKIGNLYLYEVLAKGRWKEVNKPSFEAAIKKDVEKPIQENKAANTTQETGSQTPPPPPPRTSSLPPKKGSSYQDGAQKMEFDKYIQGNTLDLHKLDSINIPELLEFLNKERDIKQINLGWNSIDDEDAEKLFRQRGLVIMENRHEEENSQNKKTPPPLPLRTSSLPPKGNVVSEQTSAEPASHNQDNRQKDERYDNPTFTTFGYTASGEKETVAEEALQVKSAALAPPTQDVALKKVEGTFKSKDAKESGNNGNKPPLNDVASILEWRAEIEFLHSEDFDNEINSQEAKEKNERRQAARKESSEGRVYNLQSLFEENSQNKKTPPPPPLRTSSLPSKKGLSYKNDRQSELSSNAADIAQKQFIENVLEKIEKGSQYDTIRNWLKDKIEGKENNQNLDSLEEKLSKKYSQGNVVEKRENDDSKLLPPTSTGGNTDVEQSSNTQPQKNSRRNGKEPEEEERNFQKISEALESWKEKRRNAEQGDSNPSSPTQDSNEQSQVDPKQLKKSLMNAGQSNDTLLIEFTSKLDKETQKFPLRPVDQEKISEQTRERLLADGLLKDNSTDVKKVAERENADTNLTIDKNSNLHRLLEKDVARLKAGVIEEEREDTLVEHTNSHDRNRIALANRNRKLLWTEHIKQQQERDKGVSI
ncbi:MAG: hypothetical protein PG978_000150 [Wolbachia endosymbiont of Ctenocephalides felis wCfeF]|nr:MAG: hypothetical protein PG978_000150 [Wolbachia endosymbiont of Ctenocephalides felis wCfeF]